MKKIWLLLLLLTLAAGICPPAGLANAAEPPAILIIVPNAPDDLKISLGEDDREALRFDKGIESYFTFNRYALQYTEYTLTVTTAGGSFQVAMEAPLRSYNNIYTLDLKTRTLTSGKSLSRSFNLISLRIITTLVIEALIFFLFGYRKKKSWLVFLIVNLITQGILNIWLGVSFTPLQGYILFPLVFGEILVFIVEISVFLSLVKERGRWLALLYVIAANTASLFLGGYLITQLPV